MSRAKAKSPGTPSDVPLPIDSRLLAAHAATIGTALRQWRAQDRVPPVLLLSGPRGCGKRAIAYFVAQTLQCERAGFYAGEGVEVPANGREPFPSACGACGPCLRALQGQAFDFTEIRPDADSPTLKIDQFREMKEKLGFASFAGSYRVFLVSSAETLTVQAANSLLKLLEEPPSGWVFLLTVTDPSLLPTTVVSRCQSLRLRPLPEETLRALLADREVPEARVPALARLAEGSITRALELADDGAWDARELLLRFLGAPGSVLHAVIDYAAGDPAQMRLLLDQFEQILNDLIVHSADPDAPYRNLDAVNDLRAHGERCVSRWGARRAREFWIGRAERLFRLRREVTVPLNQKLLIGDFLAPWLEAV